MRSRLALAVLSLSAASACWLATSEAAAQYPPPPPPGYAPPPGYGAPGEDFVRFRGGIGVNVGAFIVPGGLASFSDGMIGVTGQLGVQINNHWGVYAVPELEFLIGSPGGIGVVGAVMGDYTFDSIPLSVGLGVESGEFVAFGDGLYAGAYYGVRLHGAYYPVLSRSPYNPSRRRALFIGLDLHIDGDGFGCTGCAGGAGGVIVSPVASIGYQAF